MVVARWNGVAVEDDTVDIEGRMVNDEDTGFVIIAVSKKCVRAPVTTPWMQTNNDVRRTPTKYWVLVVNQTTQNVEIGGNMTAPKVFEWFWKGEGRHE